MSTRHCSAAAWLAASVAALVLGSAAPARAQEPVKSFEFLNRRLVVGDTVFVTDIQGREVKGKVAELQPGSLTLDANGPTRIPAGDVRLVQKQGGRSAGRGARWGLLIGGAAGLVLYGVTAGECESDCTGGTWAIAMGVGMGVGAGVGAVTGAMFRGKRRLVYQAPGAASQPRFSVAPSFGPHHKAVRMTLVF